VGFWTWLLLITAVIALAAAAARGEVRRAIRAYRVPLDYALRIALPTDDGGTIELRRLPGNGRGTPILLVHGVAANHRNVDFHPDNSLARHLSAEGRDVWLLTLRSGRRGRSRAQTRQVNFDAMVRHDLPKGIQGVLDQTGAASVDYVGFSMGGMLLYAALGRTVPAPSVRKAVIIGSPGQIQSPLFPGLVRYLRIPWLPTLYLDAGSSLAAGIAEWVRTPLHHMFYNPDMAETGWTRTALVDVIVDVPGPLSADFVRWATGDGQIRLRDGSEALPGLKPLRTPARFFAGAGDLVAPPAAVQMAFDAWAADHEDADKDLHILGSAQGAAGDYRHGDLAVGHALKRDLYTPIAEFLREGLQDPRPPDA
jgi:polyhydroxyalkanoate synthase subunit PhaC